MTLHSQDKYLLIYEQEGTNHLNFLVQQGNLCKLGDMPHDMDLLPLP